MILFVGERLIRNNRCFAVHRQLIDRTVGHGIASLIHDDCPDLINAVTQRISFRYSQAPVRADNR